MYLPRGLWNMADHGSLKRATKGKNSYNSYKTTKDYSIIRRPLDEIEVKRTSGSEG